ncbi:hypothetical protein [Andreprevotia chitinilytica]|uniref:hypothetical protein n=1 Tax=Andreprevotia chitinilytica TaxID=396808 RepID=UPI000550796D|nr:hypothetical protein [Andreprevotia chitinilytica]
MEKLASAIGWPTLQAVIDDFISTLRQHPLLASVLHKLQEHDNWRTRLAAFWHAVLDGESYRVPSLCVPSTNPIRPSQWRALGVLFRRAISRHVPEYLAASWRQRLDWFGQSLPMVRA